MDTYDDAMEHQRAPTLNSNTRVRGAPVASYADLNDLMKVVVFLLGALVVAGWVVYAALDARLDELEAERAVMTADP